MYLASQRTAVPRRTFILRVGPAVNSHRRAPIYCIWSTSEHIRIEPHKHGRTPDTSAWNQAYYCTSGKAEMTKSHLGRIKILSIITGLSLHCEDPEWDL